MSGSTSDGRTLRMLTMIDEYTREPGNQGVGRRLNSHDVIDTLAEEQGTQDSRSSLREFAPELRLVPPNLGLDARKFDYQRTVEKIGPCSTDVGDGIENQRTSGIEDRLIMVATQFPPTEASAAAESTLKGRGAERAFPCLDRNFAYAFRAPFGCRVGGGLFSRTSDQCIDRQYHSEVHGCSDYHERHDGIDEIANQELAAVNFKSDG